MNMMAPLVLLAARGVVSEMGVVSGLRVALGGWRMLTEDRPSLRPAGAGPAEKE